MQFTYLSDSVTIKTISESETAGVFEIEGLYSGYGLTLGNALRRVLFSSLPGAAITQFKIRGVGHEFSTLPNVLEDAVEIGLNLKKIRFQIHTDEPQILTLRVKGEKIVTAADFETNALIEIVTSELPIATLTAKNAELEMEIRVEKGMGYVPVEARKFEKLPIGTVALDAFFSPVVRVNFTVENMRVGERTDYNRLKLEVRTDGTISPSRAVHKTSDILRDHFDKISKLEIKDIPSAAPTEKGEKKTAKKKKKEK